MFYDVLTKKIDPKRVLVNEEMSKHISFKVGGNADFFITVNNIDELIYCLKTAKECGIKTFVIGNGTNLIVTDNGFRGAIIKLKFEKLELKDDTIIARCRNIISFTFKICF
ncbi:MAG: FAD-binding protein [Clostridia bacterium]|nr:FAD-binding protein [Clostridia bacterium]